MKVTVEDLSAVKKKITVTIPKEEVNAAVQKAYVAINKKAKVKGFRPGKVPFHILKSNFRDQMRSDVTEKLFEDTYPKALTEANVRPVSYPEVDTKGIVEDEEFVYSAAVEVMPAVELTDYKDIEVERLVVEVGAKEVEEFLTKLAESHATLEALSDTRPVKEGDIVTVDFEGFIDGKPAKDTKAENYPVEIGSGRFIKDFENNLIGKSPGERLEFPIDFEADYQGEALAGKRVDFVVDVKEIRAKKVPAIDDEFAKDVGEFSDVKALRQDVATRLEEAANRREDQAVRRRIIKMLVDKNPLEVPAALVEAQSADIIRDTEMRLRSQGLSLKMMEAKPDEVLETVRPRAQFEVKAQLILAEIAGHEGIETTKEEAEERLKRDAEAVRMKYEQLKGRYDKNDAWDGLMARMTEEKTLDFLTKLVRIKEVKKLSAKFEAQEETEGQEGR
jgi:trigger factor